MLARLLVPGIVLAASVALLAPAQATLPTCDLAHAILDTLPGHPREFVTPVPSVRCNEPVSDDSCVWSHAVGHGVTRLDKGASGTRVELTVKWDYGCPGGPVVTEASGFCAWAVADWRNEWCAWDMNDPWTIEGEFRCIQGGNCVYGSTHQLTIELNPDNYGYPNCIHIWSGTPSGYSMQDSCTP